MKLRLALPVTLICLAVALSAFGPLGCGGGGGATSVVTPGSPSGTFPTQVLARVDLSGDVSTLGLPVYALLQDKDGQNWALVKATPAQLQATRFAWQVLDSVIDGREWAYGESDKPEAYAEVHGFTDWSYSDGRNVIVRFDPDVEDAMGGAGFQMVVLDEEPMVISTGGQAKAAQSGLVLDTAVKALVDNVSRDSLERGVSRLSGHEPVTVGGETRTFTTRNNFSSQARNVEQYLKETLDGLPGVKTSYQSFDEKRSFQRNGTIEQYGCSGRNVIGEITGAELPNEVIILIAHADSITEDSGNVEAAAPGADDDASGCSALLEVARVMSGASFKRTVRFVFTMGEEEGVFGGLAYARKVYAEAQTPGGPVVKGVLNLDMVAYSTKTSLPAVCRIKTRNYDTNPNGYRADCGVAYVFRDVIPIYGLDAAIRAIVTDDNDNAGDQVRFWERDIPAAWAIEDDQNDANKNYHTSADTLSTLNLSYYTAMVKATVATTAHLAQLKTNL